MSNSFQIGWFILTKDTEYTNTFECAAWNETIIAKKGKYPVMARSLKDIEINGEKVKEVDYSSVSINVPGTIISNDTRSRFHGSIISNKNLNNDVGKKSSHLMMPYAYSIAESVLNKKKDYQLLSEFKAIEYKFKSSIDGKMITTHCILKIK